MPINENENHPYLQIGEDISGSKMIVGTFPIYSLTNPRTQWKMQLQLDRNDISYFYGSRSNYFWIWYQHFIDNLVDIQTPQFIVNSLQDKGISISDVILECSRIDESFEDNKLRNKHWNVNLAHIIENRIEKILCTSKASSGAMGWLRDRILIPAGYAVDPIESNDLHQQILLNIQDANLEVLPIAQVLIKGSKKISIVALPSPGSPERRLVDFGYKKDIHQTDEYLSSYLSASFNWFLL